MTRDVVSTSVSRCSPVTGDATRTTCEPSKPLFRPPEMTPPRRQRVASHVRVDNGATTPLEAADRGALEPCTTASLVDRNLFRVANQSTDVKLHELLLSTVTCSPRRPRRHRCTLLCAVGGASLDRNIWGLRCRPRFSSASFGPELERHAYQGEPGLLGPKRCMREQREASLIEKPHRCHVSAAAPCAELVP